MTGMDHLNRFKAGLRLFAAVLVLLAAMVVLVGSVGACGGEAKAYLSLMGAVPEDSSYFAYWAIEDLDTPDLWDIYDRFKYSPEATQAKSLLEVLDNVKQAAKVMSYEDPSEPSEVAVLRGDFNREFVERRLGEIGYSEREYKDVKIWSLDDDDTANSVAIQYPTILIGNAAALKDYISATKDNAQSLDEHPNIATLTGRLPNGVIVEIVRVKPSHGEQYDDLVAYGKSYAEVNKDTLKLTAVYLFSDAHAADAAKKQIEDSLKDSFEEITIERDDNFIIATAEISIRDLAETLAF